MTKKAASLLLAASLAVSVCATPVFATEMGSQTVEGALASGAGVGHTQVRYKVTEKYTWSVPITIDFGENAGVGNTSTVEANLASGLPGTPAVKKGTEWKGTAPRVEVIKNVIGVGKNLQITVDVGGNGTSFENNQFYVETTDTKEKLYFTIAKPAATGGAKQELTGTDNVVLRVPSGTNTANQALVFELKTANGINVAEKAGEYEGYVVFSSKIVD